MPTYEYVCENCEHSFEKFQSITARSLRKCPECGKTALNRLIGTGAGIIFKGSGFYETDYRSESYKKGEKEAKPKSDSKTEDKKTTSSETKSETPASKSSDKASKPKAKN